MAEKTIKKIQYNFAPIEGYSSEFAEVGKDGVTYIEEHRAAGEGDKWYYDIHFDNADTIRIFNPNKVYFS